MTTALELLESGAKKIGALGVGESLTADQASDGLKLLNSMLDHWAIDDLLVYQVLQSSYTWPSGTASRTIGPTGNFNTTRPARVEDGCYFQNGTTDYPVFVVRDRAVYDGLGDKTTSGSYPEIMFYDPAFPIGTLYVYPVPDTTLTLKLNTWQVLQNFASLTTDLALPPGYQYAIENNIAVEMESMFSMPVPPSVQRNAMLSKAQLMRFNHKPITSKTEVSDALGNYGSYDIVSGRYV